MSDELVNRLHEYDADRATRFRGKTLTDAAADEITALRARLEAVGKERDALKQIDAHRMQTLNHMGAAVERMQEAEARAERAEAALATARRDACGRAAMVAEAWIARKENLISLPDAIRALADEAPK